MNNVFLLFVLFVPLISFAGEKHVVIPDYMQIHKTYLSIACINEQTQQSMDQCGERSLEKATIKMKALLAALKKNYSQSEPALFKAVLDSQLRWKTYVEASCKVETYYSKNGSGFHSIWNACLEGKTNERISYLNWIMENP